MHSLKSQWKQTKKKFYFILNKKSLSSILFSLPKSLLGDALRLPIFLILNGVEKNQKYVAKFQPSDPRFNQRCKDLNHGLLLTARIDTTYHYTSLGGARGRENPGPPHKIRTRGSLRVALLSKKAYLALRFLRKDSFLPFSSLPTSSIRLSVSRSQQIFV